MTTQKTSKPYTVSGPLTGANAFLATRATTSGPSDTSVKLCRSEAEAQALVDAWSVDPATKLAFVSWPANRSRRRR